MRARDRQEVRETTMLRIGLTGLLLVVAMRGQPPLLAPALDVTIRLTAVAVDHEGLVYVTASGCVFRLESSGTLTRLAGTGITGYSGDGGHAIDAQLSYPV